MGHLWEFLSLSVGRNVLARRILFTVGILLIFRLGVHIPVPGVDTKELAAFAQTQDVGLLRLFNMFSGGALSNFSIFSLSVMPYISASIIMQLLTVVVPSLEQLQKEGGVGRQKITRMTRTFSILLAFIQGYLLAAGLELARGPSGALIVTDPGYAFRFLSAFIMAAGSCYVMWLGEQITEKGLGNGISLLIFAGIVAYLPQSMAYFINLVQQNPGQLLVVTLFTIFVLLAIFGVTFVEQSYRRVPIHYAKRLVGKRVMSAQASHLPLKVNMSGIMAAIFASTVLAVPATFLNFNMTAESPWLAALFPGSWLYNVAFVGLGIFFSFFYASIVFKPDDIAENLKRQNAYIPGIRPGRETSEILETVVSRLTLAGSFYMCLVVILPSLLSGPFSQSGSFGGTSLLIVVGVALEMIRQVSAQLASQRYDGLIFPGGGGSVPTLSAPSSEDHRL